MSAAQQSLADRIDADNALHPHDPDRRDIEDSLLETYQREIWADREALIGAIVCDERARELAAEIAEEVSWGRHPADLLTMYELAKQDAVEAEAKAKLEMEKQRARRL